MSAEARSGPTQSFKKNQPLDGRTVESDGEVDRGARRVVDLDPVGVVVE